MKERENIIGGSLLLMATVMIVSIGCGDSDSSTSPSQGGAAYYVSPTGDDGNPGTSGSPWASIGQACNTLAAGDTVYVRSGTYSERVVPGTSGSSSSNRIVYLAYPGDAPVIDGTGVSLPSGWGGLVEISNLSHIVFAGFIVQNVGSEDNHSGILVESSTDVSILNCATYNTVSSGIGVWNCSNLILNNNEVELACNDGEQECITVAGTSNFTVSNNYVHNSGPGTIGGEGIDIKDGCSTGDVYGNVVHDINRIGIYVDSWDKPTHHINVHSNLVYNTTDDGFALASESGGLLSDISVYNNISYGNTNSGITVASWGEQVPSHPIQDISIMNNTFYGNGTSSWGVGICVENPDADNVIVRNNILSENVFGQILIEEAGSGLAVDNNLFFGIGDPYGSSYLTGDPELEDPSNGDFHLQTSSPAIDAGSSTGAPSDDFEGTSRPQGSGYDMGAYEQ
ncbi:MAG: hypothetical protein GQ565_08050 [Candidatus Aegiribacteria sp.]|nr:hypothetical protein [Candidatus Aegiribacteria sp.]